MSKKRKWSALKDGLITYLAISKIFYWMNIIGDMADSNFEDAWPFILDRLLGRDLPLIIIIAALFIIDNLKGNLYIKLAFGYVAYIAILFVYSIVINWILGDGPMVGIRFFGSSFMLFTMQFVIISTILAAKERFMKKVKDEPKE